MTMENDIKPGSADAETTAAGPAAERSAFQRILTVTIGPIVAAFLLSAIILMLVGVNPLTYYGYILERSLFSGLGLQQTATRMAPLLFLCASLIIAFRAGIWNLGTDGQFLLGAVISAATAPFLVGVLPGWAVLLIGFVLAALVGAVWSVIPALLKAYQGVNEIITTLMMSFLGVLLASTLVKLVFRDPTTTVPQTRTLPVEDRLPRLFRHVHFQRADLGPARGSAGPPDDDPHRLRAAAADGRGQSRRRHPCRAVGAAADHGDIRPVGGLCRPGRGLGDPRRRRQRERQLESGLWPDGDPAGLSCPVPRGGSHRARLFSTRLC